jgi:hypothetical protein
MRSQLTLGSLLNLGPIKEPFNRLDSILNGTYSVEDAYKIYDAEIEAERRNRFEILALQYGVNSKRPSGSAYKQLAFKFACDFHPSFQVESSKPKSGRPKADDEIQIALGVLELVLEKRLSERSACFHLAKQSNFAKYGNQPGTLYRRYKMLKKGGSSDTLSNSILSMVFAKIRKLKGSRTAP